MTRGAYSLNASKTVVAFRFHKASCVAVGTFNMYILHPQWLVRHDVLEEGANLLEEGAAIGIETNLTQPGFRFRLPKGQTTLHVSPTRLVVESADSAFDCGQIVAKVLKALPETPLFALGNNAVFQAEPSELEQLAAPVRSLPRFESPSSELAVEQRTFHLGVRRQDQGTINLQLSLKDDLIELSCNVHSNLENHERPSEPAILAASRFFLDRMESQSLVQTFFGALIPNAPHNART